MPSSAEFWKAVAELAALRKHTPPERRAMSGVLEYFRQGENMSNKTCSYELDLGCADVASLDDAKEEALLVDQINGDVDSELAIARARFPSFNSAHEGFAVLKEEVDELWDEVKAKQGARDVQKMRKEAVQVAAMAMRFILDVCDADRGQK